MGDYNEQWHYDSDTQLISEMAINMCIATGSSPLCSSFALNGAEEPCLPGVTGVCQVTCDAQSPNQRWIINATDQSIRLAASPDWCLTVASASEANIVYLAPCESGSATQGWVFSAGVQYAGVFGRLAEAGDRTRTGYGFTLSEDGQYQLSFQGIPLASGLVSVPVLGFWHDLSLRFQGDTISGFINGTNVVQVQDSSSSSGLIALVSNWGIAYFDDFSVGPGPSGAPTV